MAKKLKGFSLAEVLITLLVVGIVGAAAIPTMTKRSTGTDKMWDWADYPVGSAYSVGTHVLLNASADNANRVPELSVSGYYPNVNATIQSALDTNAEPEFDKLILMNNFHQDAIPAGKGNNFAKPHISFYNKSRSLLGGIVTDYAGSLTADRANLALGIGSLQRLVPTATEGLFNTAVGHYALFNDKYGSNNTALGNLALFTLGHNLDNIEEDQGRFNVAIGNNSQSNNTRFDLNTSVGADSLTGLTTNGGNRNVALGAQALGTSDVDNRFFQRDNIAIGANAGYNEGTNGTVSTAKNANRLFIGDSTGTNKSLIEAEMTNSVPIPNPLFNINADELIVNTADGKHTLLKIRMIDDAGVPLPNLTDSGYSSLGYCKGEGSDDVGKANNDPSALAEVCIAKFTNNAVVSLGTVEVVVGGEGDSTFLTRIRTLFTQILKNTQYVVKEPQITYNHVDWDIYLKGLNVGIYGFTSTNLTSNRAYIQTVKAALNYFDTWKEGMGLLSSMMQAFTDNFICFFDFLDAGEACNSYNEEDPYTFGEYIKDKIEAFFGNFQLFVDNPVAFFDSIGDKIQGKIQERKNERIAKYQQKLSECYSKKIGKQTCINHYQNLLNIENASDKRLKNVEGKSVAGLKEINALKIKNYTYKADKTQTPHVGVIAQELQQVFPNSVFEGPNGYLKIKQEEIFYAMVNAIKELDEQSIELKGEIPKVNKQIKTTVDKNKKLLTKNEKLKLENEKLMAQLKELEK